MDWEQDSDQEEDPGDGQGVLSAAVVRTQSSPHPPVRLSDLLSALSVLCCQTSSKNFSLTVKNVWSAKNHREEMTKGVHKTHCLNAV